MHHADNLACSASPRECKQHPRLSGTTGLFFEGPPTRPWCSGRGDLCNGARGQRVQRAAAHCAGACGFAGTRRCACPAPFHLVFTNSIVGRRPGQQRSALSGKTVPGGARRRRHGTELKGKPGAAHRVSGSSSHYVRVNSPQKPPTAPTTISRWPWGLRSLLHPFFWGGPPGGDKRRKKACISLTHAQCNMVHCRLNHEGYSASMLTRC